MIDFEQENKILKDKVKALESAQLFRYNLAIQNVKKLTKQKWLASGFIIEISSMNGKQLIEPVLITDGFDQLTIDQLTNEIKRSYDEKLNHPINGVQL